MNDLEYYEISHELAMSLLARMRADKIMGRRGSWPAEAEALCVHITDKGGDALAEPKMENPA